MANPYTAYVENRVLTASPLELVHLAYEGAMEAIEQARTHLADNQIVPRIQATTRAQQIIIHLQASLDFEKGADLSKRLSALYDYVLRRINDGNREMSDSAFVEVHGLLKTLDEGWKQIAQGETAVATAAVEEAASSASASASTSYGSPWTSSEPAFYAPTPEPAFYTSAGYL